MKPRNIELGCAFQNYRVLPALVALGSALLCLSGCQSLRTLGEFRSDLVLREQPSQVDLLRLLRKDNKLAKASSELTESEYQVALEDAYVAFNDIWGQSAAAQRNLILDRLVLASSQTCERYKADLVHRQARGNFILGILGTTLGAAGAVIRTASAASSFAAAAGVTSGVRAEYNQEFFADKGAQVLASAIDKLRKDLELEFAKAKKFSVVDYSVQQAVTDGITYNGACGFTGAMAYTQNAIVQLDPNKGIKITLASIAIQAAASAPLAGPDRREPASPSAAGSAPMTGASEPSK